MHVRVGQHHVILSMMFPDKCSYRYTVYVLFFTQGVVKGLVSLPLLGMSKAGADTLYHWIYTQRYVSVQYQKPFFQNKL